MTAYPLLQILFFIAALFAPKDTTEISVAGPHHNAHWTLTANGWSEESKLWSLDGNSTVVRDNGRPDEIVDVSAFVKAALENDWTKEKKIKLFSTTSLEKTNDGFILRLNAGDKSEMAYQIAYGKKS